MGIHRFPDDCSLPGWVKISKIVGVNLVDGTGTGTSVEAGAGTGTAVSAGAGTTSFTNGTVCSAGGCDDVISIELWAKVSLKTLRLAPSRTREAAPILIIPFPGFLAKNETVPKFIGPKNPPG